MTCHIISRVVEASRDMTHEATKASRRPEVPVHIRVTICTSGRAPRVWCGARVICTCFSTRGESHAREMLESCRRGSREPAAGSRLGKTGDVGGIRECDGDTNPRVNAM